MHAFDFLEQPATKPQEGLWVLHGDDRWLRKTVLQEFQRRMLGDDGEVGPVRLGDRTLEWAEVADHLASVSLFGPPLSFVVVEDADKFVSDHRAHIEAWANQPTPRAILLLEVSSWPSNTRLAKWTAEQDRSIDCGAPMVAAGRGKRLDVPRLAQWLIQRAQSVHGASLDQATAKYLIDHSPVELGLLDQHVAKMAICAMEGRPIDAALIDEVIGGWRQQDAFAMIHLALDGKGAEAVRLLERLVQGGEAPQALFGAVAYVLRKFASAVRILEQDERRTGRRDLRRAIQQAGFFRPDEQQAAEQRLRHLGRLRCRQMYRRLLAIDLALKGTHAAPDRGRWLFEQTLIELAQPARLPRAGA